MSTHDYVIANQNGANTRSDLNNAFSAIVSNNSSASEPSTTYAYMWWADTANDLLKQRNAADSAWINILTLSTGVPSGGFKNDGTENLTSLGIDDNATSTAITIDSSENVGIGTGSPAHKTSISGSSGSGTLGLYSSGTSDELRFEHSGTNWIMNAISDGIRFKANNSDKIRIDGDGLKFNGDTAAANALDDYEEGTWTPTVSGGTMTITVNSATYTKVGDMVTVWCHVGGGNNGDGTTLIFTGLPFTSASGGSNYYAVGSPLDFNNNNATLTNPHTRVSYSSSTIYFYNNGSGGVNQSQLDYGHLIFSITYKVA